MSSSMERVLYAIRQEGISQGIAEGISQGIAAGKAEDIIELLEDCGEVKDSLKEEIYNQKDAEALKKWVKLAARAETVEDFEKAIGLVVR